MELLQRHFDIALETPDGIKKLRELILSLATQGKLVPQDPNDQPASELLEEIEVEKKRLIREGKIKRQEPLPPIKPEEIPYEVPKGWEWVRLNDYGTWKSGTTPSRTNSGYYGGNIPWVKSGEVKQGRISETSETITEKALEDCSLSLNPVGSVLIAMYGANIGEVGILEIEATTNQAICACKTYSSIDKIFLVNLLDAQKQNFISQGAGAAQPNISREKIITTVVPLPPLSEQKRIVAKIDQLMALCDKLETERDKRNRNRLSVHTAAMNRLLSAPDNDTFSNSWNFIANHFSELYSVTENMAELKKAILQLAMQGKLVPQDPNDQPASELLKEIEVEKKRLIREGKIKRQEPLPPIKPEEIPYGVPKGWEWVRLGTIGSTNIGLTYSPKDISETGIPVMRSNNIQKGKIDLSNLVRVNKEIKDNLYVQKGDILICARNGSKALVGKSAQIKELPEKMVFGAFMAIFRSRCNSYIEMFLNSPVFRKFLADVSTTTINQITQNNLKNTMVPLPPLAEQKRIVAKIDQLMELCNTLEQHIKDSSVKQAKILNAVLAKL